jgi:metal-responsive CopG/Arc/MetJ family transcriptional regulator
MAGIDNGMTNRYTTYMKTAISVPDELFKEIEKVAKESHYSRSEVFVLAVREYLEKRRSKRLLAELNEAYASAEAPEEYKVRSKSKKRYAKAGLKERY